MNLTMNFSPQVGPGALALARAGTVLTINGVEYDLAALADGDSAPPEAFVGAEDMIVGEARREAGRVALTLRLPLAADAPAAARFPAPIVDPADGPIALPGDPTDA